MNLNDNQLKAVNKTEGPLRIVAGPGSGKTRTIVSKITHILENNLAFPEEILAISFTNKAANEIKERVHKDGGTSMRNIYTYHGWCHYFLRLEAEALGLGKDFTIIDASDSKSRITNLIKEGDFGIDKGDAIEAFEKISREEMKIKDMLESEHSAHVQIALLWEKYTNEKRVNGQLDFNDLISEVKRLLTTNEYIREKWASKYKYIFIDEFQDTNNVQFEIIRALTKPDSNITVVGDPDQNIYSWRGANIDIINNFETWYPTTETIFLDVNYRSTPQIINASNSLIQNNVNRVQGFKSIPNKEFGTEIQFIHEDTDNDEAWSVARRIEALHRNGTHLHDIAIIVRMSYKTRMIETALNNMRIPYRVIGAMKFFDRAEVKQTIKFLLFAAKQDDMTLLNVINEPPKKFGPKKVQTTKAAADEQKIRMWDYLKQNRDKQPTLIKEWIDLTEKMIFRVQANDDVTLVLEEYLTEIGYLNRLFEEPNRIENIKEVLKLIRNTIENGDDKKTISEKIIDFYNSSMLSSSSDKSTEEGEVNIITAHASKGTEFPFVFLYSFVEGHWPSNKAIENGDLEEERRVAYVAATRAMEQLIVTSSDGYNPWSPASGEQSRFLDELLDKNKYNYSEKAKMSFSSDNNESQTTHTVGDDIFHNTFGEGVVVHVDDSFITVEFNDGRVQEILIGHKSYRKI